MMSHDEMEIAIEMLPEMVKEDARKRFKNIGRLNHLTLPIEAMRKLLELMEQVSVDSDEEELLMVEQIHQAEIEHLTHLGNFSHRAVFTALGLYDHFWEVNKRQWMTF